MRTASLIASLLIFAGGLGFRAVPVTSPQGLNWELRAALLPGAFLAPLTVSYNTGNIHVAIKLKIPPSAASHASQPAVARRRRRLHPLRAVLLRSLCLLLRPVRPHHQQKDERADLFDLGKDLFTPGYGPSRRPALARADRRHAAARRSTSTPTRGRTRRWEPSAWSQAGSKFYLVPNPITPPMAPGFSKAPTGGSSIFSASAPTREPNWSPTNWSPSWSPHSSRDKTAPNANC